MNKQEYLQFYTQKPTHSKTPDYNKAERIITSPQQAVITLSDNSKVINLCANNYLGLADDAS